MLWVITGASRGIGLAMTRHLLARGDEVVAVCRTLTADLSATGARIISSVDLTTADAPALVAAALPPGAVLHAVVHNAGTALPSRTGLVDLEADAMRYEYDVNALAPLRLTQALLSRLGAGSRIAIISSRAGSIGDNGAGGLYGYRMSKAAANMAGVSLARDLAPRGISVVLLHPGMVRTDLLAAASGGIAPAMTAGVLLLEPDDVAPMLVARIDELTVATSGRFLTRTGEVLPW
jgi:NAD(P)-dependent dehydrogenase (short-subunit alcohol dehydrogenase family)